MAALRPIRDGAAQEPAACARQIHSSAYFLYRDYMGLLWLEMYLRVYSTHSICAGYTRDTAITYPKISRMYDIDGASYEIQIGITSLIAGIRQPCVACHHIVRGTFIPFGNMLDVYAMPVLSHTCMRVWSRSPRIQYMVQGCNRAPCLMWY